MTKGINNTVKTMTLADFGRLVHVQADGKFATSIAKTSGNIYADKNGTVHNATHAITAGKGDAAQNLALRQQLIQAFRDCHATDAFLADACKALGLEPGATEAKPISRRTVKELLFSFNAGGYRTSDDAPGTVKRSTDIQTWEVRDVMDDDKDKGWVEVFANAGSPKAQEEAEKLRRSISCEMNRLTDYTLGGVERGTAEQKQFRVRADRFISDCGLDGLQKLDKLIKERKWDDVRALVPGKMPDDILSLRVGKSKIIVPAPLLQRVYELERALGHSDEQIRAAFAKENSPQSMMVYNPQYHKNATTYLEGLERASKMSYAKDSSRPDIKSTIGYRIGERQKEAICAKAVSDPELNNAHAAFLESLGVDRQSPIFQSALQRLNAARAMKVYDHHLSTIQRQAKSYVGEIPENDDEKAKMKLPELPICARDFAIDKACPKVLQDVIKSELAQLETDEQKDAFLTSAFSDTVLDKMLEKIKDGEGQEKIQARMRPYVQEAKDLCELTEGKPELRKSISSMLRYTTAKELHGNPFSRTSLEKIVQKTETIASWAQARDKEAPFNLACLKEIGDLLIKVDRESVADMEKPVGENAINAGLNMIIVGVARNLGAFGDKTNGGFLQQFNPASISEAVKEICENTNAKLDGKLALLALKLANISLHQDLKEEAVEEAHRQQADKLYQDAHLSEEERGKISETIEQIDEALSQFTCLTDMLHILAYDASGLAQDDPEMVELDKDIDSGANLAGGIDRPGLEDLRLNGISDHGFTRSILVQIKAGLKVMQKYYGG